MSKTTRNIVTGSVVIILLVGLAWYVTAQQAPTTTPDTTTPVTTPIETTDNNTTDDTASDQSVITFTDNDATPETLTVKAGEAITIRNDSSSSVEFSSDSHPTHREHPEINLQVLQPGTQTKLTITKPGTYAYHDHLNASHTGSIIVTN